jgi:3-mercaptopyruvate sulfurtransferase SseA
MGIDPYGPAVLYGNSGHEVTGLWFFPHEIIGSTQVRLYDGSMSSRPVAYMPTW